MIRRREYVRAAWALRGVFGWQEDIAAEVKYLRRIEKRYGSHGLWLSAIVRLNAELVRRGAKYV